MLSGIGAASHQISDSVGGITHRDSESSGQAWASGSHRLESAASIAVCSGVVRKIDDMLGLVCRR